MKRFLALILGGTLFFMAVAMAQEWRVFAGAWFGARGGGAPTLPVPEAAHEAVRRFLLISNHLYASGFDPRFAERLPASPAAIDEVQADIEYLRHRGWVQEPQLVRLTFLQERAVTPERVEIATQENWIFETKLIRDRGLGAPPVASIVRCRYLVQLEGTRWQVQSWDIIEGSR